jgi:hypothetical protein
MFCKAVEGVQPRPEDQQEINSSNGKLKWSYRLRLGAVLRGAAKPTIPPETAPVRTDWTGCLLRTRVQETRKLGARKC